MKGFDGLVEKCKVCPGGFSPGYPTEVKVPGNSKVVQLFPSRSAVMGMARAA